MKTVTVERICPANLIPLLRILYQRVQCLRLIGCPCSAQRQARRHEVQACRSRAISPPRDRRLNNLRS